MSGFIDLQINGAFGVDFSSPDLTEEDVETVAQGLLKYGVTAFCPTVVTSSVETYMKVLPLLHRKEGSVLHGASVLGAHCEGPFIAVKGAHAEEWLDVPRDGIKSVLQRYGSVEHVQLVTLAPELPNAIETIKQLVSVGIVVSIGHSAASIDVAEAAVDAGATMITHLFNAMAGTILNTICII